MHPELSTWLTSVSASSRPIDGGANWIRVFTGPAVVTSIIIDPIDPNTVYATTLAGFLKSINAGATWSLMSGLSSKPLWDVAIDPTNHDVLYVATNTSGVWRSPDAGASWQPTGPLSAVPYSVSVDPSPAHAILVGTSEGVWKSSDGGASWQPTALTDRAAQIDHDRSQGGFCTRERPRVRLSLRISVRRGRIPIPEKAALRRSGMPITVDPNSGCKLFASTLGAAALISDNEGVSWTRVGTDYAVRESRQIAVDPTDSSRVYSGSFYSGLFKSVDGGATWSRRSFGSGSAYVWIPVVDPVSPNIVYAGTVGEGLFKSEDYGDSWTSVPGLPATVQGLTVDPRNNQELFAAATNGIYRSDDAGQTWLRVLDLPAWSITIVGGDSQVVYATTKRQGVYKSLDGGKELASEERRNHGHTDGPIGTGHRRSRALGGAVRRERGWWRSVQEHRWRRDLVRGESWIVRYLGLRSGGRSAPAWHALRIRTARDLRDNNWRAVICSVVDRACLLGRRGRQRRIFSKGCYTIWVVQLSSACK